MPAETGYDPQIAPGGAATAPAQAGPDAFGAGIGQGIEQVGGALHRRDLNAYELERKQQQDQQAAGFAAGFTQARADADAASVDMRNNAAPGGAGHAQAMADWWETRKAALLDGISEDRVRLHAQQQLDAFGASLGSSEYQWQAGAGAAKLVADTRTMIDTAANRARTSSDPKAFEQELTAGVASIEAMQGVPADVRDKLQHEYAQSVTIGHANGMLDRGEVGALRTVIASGALDARLTPEQIDHLSNGVEIEQRRIDALAEHQAALAKAAVHEQVATVNARLQAGEDVPQAVLTQTAADARAIGDESGAYKLEVARAQAGINRATQPWTPTQFREAIDGLEAKGGKRSPAEDVTLAQLKRIEPERTKNFTADPGAWAALNGLPRPTFDPANPQSGAAIEQWAARMQHATGTVPPPLAADQAAQMHAIATTGTAQERVALAQSVLSLGKLSSKAGDQIGGDADFQASMALGGRPNSGALIAMALDGATANDKALLTPAMDAAGEPASATPEALLAHELGGALALMPDDFDRDLKLNARNIYLYQAKRTGLKAFDPATMQAALREALGAKLAHWAGDRVLLPPTMTAASFERRVGQATSIDWTNASAKHALPWTSGGAMTPAEMRGYVPTKTRSGLYRLRQGNGYAVNQDGSFFEFDPAKLWDGPRASAPQERPLSSFERHPFAH